MRKLLRAALLSSTLLAAACGGKATPRPADTGPAPAADAAPAMAPAAEADAAPDCVAECIRSRQMQAVSPEQIEAGCRRDCAGK